MKRPIDISLQLETDEAVALIRMLSESILSRGELIHLGITVKPSEIEGRKVIAFYTVNENIEMTKVWASADGIEICDQLRDSE